MSSNDQSCTKKAFLSTITIHLLMMKVTNPESETKQKVPPREKHWDRFMKMDREWDPKYRKFVRRSRRTKKVTELFVKSEHFDGSNLRSKPSPKGLHSRMKPKWPQKVRSRTRTTLEGIPKPRRRYVSNGSLLKETSYLLTGDTWGSHTSNT